jgi:DNA modification methylase
VSAVAEENEFIDKNLNGDCLDILPKLPKNCVKCFAFDPPYNLAKKYGESANNFENLRYEEYCDRMQKFFKLAYDCAREDAYLAFLTPNEKQKIIDLNNAAEKAGWIKIDSVLVNEGNDYLHALLVYGREKSERINLSEILKLKPGEIWICDKWHEDKNGLKTFHRFTWNPDVPQKLIEVLTQEGEIVCDPFNGIGTTTEVAKKLKRHFIGIEIEDYQKQWEQIRSKSTDVIQVSDSTSSPSSTSKELSELVLDLIKLGGRAASWYGEQFLREFIVAVASENLQRFNSTGLRIITHKLFFARYGMMKSVFLNWAYAILNDPNPNVKLSATFIGSTTKEAMRGSVVYVRDEEGNEVPLFVAPLPCQFRYFLVDEWSSIAGKRKDEEYESYLLTLIESGRAQVSLVKNRGIKDEDRRKLEKEHAEYGLRFTADQLYEYRAWPLWLAATHDEATIQSDALRSRFDIVLPERQFDSALLNHIKNTQFEKDEDLFAKFRASMNTELKIPAKFTNKILGELVPDELVVKYGPELGYDLHMRLIRDAGAYVLVMSALGFDINANQIEDFIKQKLAVNERIGKGAREIILENLQINKAGLTSKELLNLLGNTISIKTINYHLETLMRQKLVEMTLGKPPKYRYTGAKNIADFL